MASRRLIPLALVGILAVAVAGFAALGASESPSPLSNKAQSEEFHLAIRQTLASKSFTIHFGGQTIVYQAPDRTEVVEVSPGATSPGISLVTIGPNSYTEFGSTQWLKGPSGFPGSIGIGTLGYLRALSSFKTATLDGSAFTVRGVLSDLPKPLVTVIFTTVTHGTNGQNGASFSLSNPNEHAKVVGRIGVFDGRITSETFTAFDAYPARGRRGATRTGSVTYSAFDSSPAITPPTKAELSPPCQPGSKGSCQVTIKGTEPHSAMCKDIRTYDRRQRAEAQAAALVPAVAKSSSWSAQKKVELSILAALGNIARAVALSTDAPQAVQVADKTELKYLPRAKANLLKAKDAAQFQFSSSSAAAKALGSFGLLTSYEQQQCGGTESYTGMVGLNGGMVGLTRTG